MAVTIRLARHGQRNRPYYRVVVADKQFFRDGRFLEVVGQYDSRTNPQTVNLKEDRIRYWIGSGAQASDLVKRLIIKKMPGYLEAIKEARTKKIQAARKARKTRAAGKTDAGKATKKAAAPKAAKKTVTKASTKKA